MKSHSCAWERYLCLAEKFPNKFIQHENLSIELDEQKVIQYEEKYQVTIGVIYESPYNTLVVDLVHNQNGDYFTYERLLPTLEKGACVMLPIYNGRIIIMKQYRHALRDYQYAIPRGFAEPGLTVEQNCQKEMMEELGGSIHSLFPLSWSSIFVTPIQDKFNNIVFQMVSNIHSRNVGVYDYNIHIRIPQ